MYADVIVASHNIVRVCGNLWERVECEVLKEVPCDLEAVRLPSPAVVLLTPQGYREPAAPGCSAATRR